MTDLLVFIRSYADLSDESWDILSKALIKTSLRKGEYVLQAGQVCNSLYFISSGYCRAFQLQEGIEVNTSFYFEHDIATNINSYLTQSPSSFSIQACEPVVAYRFDKQKAFEMSKLSPEIDRAGKGNLRFIAAKQERQLELFRLLTAKKRYEYLEKNEPQMLQRVSLTHLSSYLGVARETLSRIRKKRTIR